MKTGTLYGIGVGPGDPELLTVRGANLLARLPHLFVPKRGAGAESVALEIVKQFLSKETRIHEIVFPMTGNSDELAAQWAENARELAVVLETGADAGFITLGDPFLYSTYIYLVRALRKLLPDVAVMSVPGVTSFSAAAALAGFPIGEGKEPVTIIPAADNLNEFEAALLAGGTVILMKIGRRLEKVLEILEKTGLIGHGIFVSRAGMPGERVVTDLRELKNTDPQTGYLSIILVHAKGRRRA